MEEMSLPVTREILIVLLSAGLTEAIIPDTSRILLIYFAEAAVSLSSNSFCSAVALIMKSGFALAISVCFRLNIYRAARIADKAINVTTNNPIFTYVFILFYFVASGVNFIITVTARFLSNFSFTTPGIVIL